MGWAGRGDTDAVISGVPAGEVALPRAAIAAANGDRITPVWRNQLGGLTFELGHGAGRRFLKWAPAGSGLDLDAEIARLGWIQPLWPAPRVLDYGVDDDGSWLLTAGLAGDSAVAPRWVAQPRLAVRAIGAGLRALHDALPVETCPFSWSVQHRRERAYAAAEARAASAADVARLADAPDPDRIVVCHGDACAPNTLIGGDGRWSGHVDFDALGVADRWADLAVATWSTEWNYGAGWEAELLDAYGIDPDPHRTAYYRLLWDLTP
ncbi:MAG: putative aminoglycoside 3-phosphotransferase [Pseudonocardiales bacterium]|nr:putative aminoglycoside 3-phosphotransferase [Pseudonocardiales bacterium]